MPTPFRTSKPAEASADSTPCGFHSEVTWNSYLQAQAQRKALALSSQDKLMNFKYFT